MDDLISRQDAIDAVARVMVIKSRGGRGSLIAEAVGSAKVIIADNIRQLPPIQPAEPKRGRWVGKYPVTSVCSECGYLINDSKVKVFAFCPNCGAKMEVDDE